MRKLAFVASGVGVLALALSATMSAEAATSVRPSAVFAFKHDRVTHGVKPVLTYRTGHLPRRSIIYLQRQYGSAHVWKNVERLKARTGTVTAPGVQIGKYAYRIRVTKSGRKVVISATRALYSYATVAYATLCREYWGGSSCSAQTVQIGEAIFTYVWESYGGQYPTYVTPLEFASTSCSSLSVDFATNDPNSSDTAYLKVIQSGSDPQYASTAAGTIGKFSPKLDGGPFYLEASETNGSYGTYLSGHATCYTPTGKP